MNPASGKLLSDSRWPHVKFLIKANENEQFFLWKEHSTHSNEKGMEWNKVGASEAFVIDTIDGKPIAVCVTFVKLDDVLVAFYDSSSRLVDWDIITSWFKEVFKGKWGNDKPAVCGYQNFKDCVKFVKNKSSREQQEKTTKSV